jgi:hypothetical protein
MYCPNCRTRRVVRIGVTLNGSSLTLSACSACDVRWWDEEGEIVDIARVYEMAGPARG